MANEAAFTINGTPSVDPTTGDREFTATNGQTLSCTLEASPSEALSVRFEVFDPANLLSPLASDTAPLITWVENSLAAITLAAVNDTVTINIPAAPGLPVTGIFSYLIRCTVSTAGDGSPSSQEQVFERLVSTYSLATTPAVRKTVPGESTQGFTRAWSDAINAMIDALENATGGIGGALQASYVLGNTIAVTAANGAVAMSNSVDVTTVLALSISGAFAHDALGIAMAAGSTGHGIAIAQDATDSGSDGINIQMASGADGQGIEIVHAGSAGAGDLLNAANSTAHILRVGADGSAELQGNSGGNVLMTAEGTGVLQVGTLGTGDLSLLAAGGGNVVIDATAAGTGIQLSHAGGVTIVRGNLVVEGTTTTVDSETVMLGDNHLYLNAGYTTAAAQTGGLVVNYLPTATGTTVNGAYVAGIPAGINPSVGTVGAATFALGDFVQFSGGGILAANEGLYEVLSHSANVLTVRGVGSTAAVEDFTQNQFAAGASDASVITKVTISVIRAGTDGVWETGSGAVTPIVFTDIGGGGGGGVVHQNWRWEFDSTITDADPGNGKFRLDNATQNDSLEMFLNEESTEAVGLQVFFDTLDAGAWVYAQQVDDSTRWKLFLVSALTVSDTNYSKLQITVEDFDADFQNGSDVEFMVFTAAGSGGGGGDLVSWDITQATHGLAVTDAVRLDSSGDYVKAKADAGGTLGVFIVVAVDGANDFTVGLTGHYTDAGHGLTIGDYYFVSEATAGLLTATEPVAPNFSNPLVLVEDADTLVIVPWRPSAAGGGAAIVEEFEAIPEFVVPLDGEDAPTSFSGSVLQGCLMRLTFGITLNRLQLRTSASWTDTSTGSMRVCIYQAPDGTITKTMPLVFNEVVVGSSVAASTTFEITPAAPVVLVPGFYIIGIGSNAAGTPTMNPFLFSQVVDSINPYTTNQIGMPLTFASLGVGSAATPPATIDPTVLTGNVTVDSTPGHKFRKV